MLIFGEEEVDVEFNVFGGKMGMIDDFMLGFFGELFKNIKFELLKDKKKCKKKRGKDMRKR